MKDNKGCKAVMYHYIRENSDFMPNLKYLHVEDFKKQLEFFEKEYGFINKNDWERFINGETSLPSGILLTFDDGLVDHYKFVLPILKQRNLWGIFFVCTRPLMYKEILNVHKIHYLLGRYDPKRVYETLKEVLNDLHLKDDIEKIESIHPYSTQQLDEYSSIIKKINYFFDQDTQAYILNKLLDYFYQPSDIIWSEIYMNEEEIKEIKNSGNIIGGHSESHFLLSKCDLKGLDREIVQSNKRLSNVIGSKVDVFCYPYGGVDSYNKETISTLDQARMKYSFCVNPKDIVQSDILLNRYELPRYDCNMFKYGKINGVE